MFARSVAVVTALLAFLSPCLADVDTTPIIVLREDDARHTWRNPRPEFGGLSALEYGKLKQIPITWGVISLMATNGESLTWDELRGYLDVAGGEPASHSVNHKTMDSTQAYIDEVINSKAEIDAHFGPTYTCTTFLQPGAWTEDGLMDRFSRLDNPVGLAVQSTYAQSQAYLAGGWTIGSIHYKHGAIPLNSLDYNAGLSVTSVKAALDVITATPGVIYVFTCHGIQPTGGTHAYEVPADVMKYFMDTVAGLRSQGKIRLMSLRDAYAQTLPDDLNRVPNPSFDICTEGYSNPSLGWTPLYGASILETQGVAGTRCGRVATVGGRIQSEALILPPGRYEVSWRQSCEQGYPLSAPVYLLLSNYANPSSTTIKLSANYARQYSTATDTWEPKRALVLVRDRLPRFMVAFQGSHALGMRIDDVSLIRQPVDNATCPSNISVSVNPTGGIISWDTPPDQAVTQIDCRYGDRTHPVTATEGTSLGTTVAAPGTRQSRPFTYNWASSSAYGMYLSVFAMGGSGASDPEIEYVVIDKTPPTVTSSVSGVDTGCATLSWTASDTESSLFRTQYAIGSTSGAADVVAWTDAEGGSIDLTDLPSGRRLYASIKAQNQFGYWSAPATQEFACPAAVAYALDFEDGTEVTVKGVVTAKFAECFYVEQPDRLKAIKVMGTTTASEGTSVVVTGTITTDHGARALVR